MTTGSPLRVDLSTGDLNFFIRLKNKLFEFDENVGNKHVINTLHIWPADCPGHVSILLIMIYEVHCSLRSDCPQRAVETGLQFSSRARVEQSAVNLSIRVCKSVIIKLSAP